MQHWKLNKITSWVQTRSSEVLHQRVVFVCLWFKFWIMMLEPPRLFFRFILLFFNWEFVSISFQGQIKPLNGVCAVMWVREWEQNKAASWNTLQGLLQPPLGRPRCLCSRLSEGSPRGGRKRTALFLRSGEMTPPVKCSQITMPMHAC